MYRLSILVIMTKLSKVKKDIMSRLGEGAHTPTSGTFCPSDFLSDKLRRQFKRQFKARTGAFARYALYYTSGGCKDA